MDKFNFLSIYILDNVFKNGYGYALENCSVENKRELYK